jgi:acetyltransferase
MSAVLSSTATVEHALMEIDPDEARVETLRDGTEVQTRPLHRSDAELQHRFVEARSTRSRRFRFLDPMSSPAAALLRQLAEIDTSMDVAYVAVVVANGEACEVGVARFNAAPGGTTCEFAFTVPDAWQREGLGTLLMRRLVEAASARGITAMHSGDARDHDCMRRFGAHLHFQSAHDPDDVGQLVYRVDLTMTRTSTRTSTQTSMRPVID